MAAVFVCALSAGMAGCGEVAATPDAQPKDVGRPIEVQINPATLRLQMASTVDFGKDLPDA